MAFNIWVTVKPRARRTDIQKTGKGEYLARVSAPAREEKANQALIDLLADHFSAPRSSIKILLGATSRRKLVEIG